MKFDSTPTLDDVVFNHATSTPTSTSPPIREGTIRLRHITAFHIGLFGFFSVAGGPIGIEPAIAAAGPFITLIAMIVTPIFWAVPQAWMTAELSTIFDENGGSILWVRDAMGNFSGFINAQNNVWSNTFDLALYPMLCVENLEQILPLTKNERICVIIAITVLVFILNVFSLQVVGRATVLLCLTVLTPYVIWTVGALVDNRLNWNRLFMSNSDPMNWGLFINTLIWNYTGWDNLGDIAGEVKDPKRSYPIGILLAVLMTMLNYLIPVVIAVCMSSSTNWSAWDEGHFVHIAKEYAPWLGTAVCFGAIIAMVGTFLSTNAMAARSLYRVAREHMLPSFFTFQLDRYQSPLSALCFQLITTVCLSIFVDSIAILMEMNNFMSVTSLLFETISFVVLRVRRPDIERCCKLPGGMLGVFTVIIPKCALLFIILAVASPETWLVCGICNILFVIIYPLWRHQQSVTQSNQQMKYSLTQSL